MPTVGPKGRRGILLVLLLLLLAQAAKIVMAEKMLPARQDLMRELKEMEELLSSKQSYMRMVPERTTKRFPRFTISTEMSIRSMFGEIAEKTDGEEIFGADSN